MGKIGFWWLDRLGLCKDGLVGGVLCMGVVTEVERGKGVRFERKRRVTGYISGDLNTWNSAKRAEERDRVKHC